MLKFPTAFLIKVAKQNIENKVIKSITFKKFITNKSFV